MAKIQLNDYLKITEAVKYIGVSANSRINWERGGKITVQRHPIYGYRLFNSQDLDLLLTRLNQHQPAPTPKWALS